MSRHVITTISSQPEKTMTGALRRYVGSYFTVEELRKYRDGELEVLTCPRCKQYSKHEHHTTKLKVCRNCGEEITFTAYVSSPNPAWPVFENLI